MKQKTLQHFSEEYLEQCKTMSKTDIVEFLEGFRELHGERKGQKSRLISIKIPEDLLETFRTKSELERIPYQTQIKNLMKAWLLK